MATETHNTLLDTIPAQIGDRQSVTAKMSNLRPIRVFMMDLLSIVPYYTGHLCSALKGIEGLRVDVGASTYHLDRGYFRRQALRTNPGLFDLVSRVPIAPVVVRRVLKSTECMINMIALLVRFVFAKPDVIHVQFLPMVKFGFPFELWFLAVVRRLGIKVVYTVHNVLPHDTGELYRAKYLQIYNLADRLICHDVCARDRLVNEFGMRADRISIIPHGPLLEQSSARTPEQARKTLGIGADQNLVLWQGILRPYKGVPFLLKAWSQVHPMAGRAILAIVGGGDAELIRAIKETVSSLGLRSSVRLDLRFVSVTELADYYLAADVLTYPYSDVTTSGALMTGLGYGKAIVATKLPAFEELLHDGKNALLVKFGDANQLAETLIRLIGEPNLRNRLGERARKSYLNSPPWLEIARETFAFYQSVVAKACPGGSDCLP